MNDETLRLSNMLKEKKITQNDYRLLSEALNKKSFCSEIESSVFFNPFQKIAGFKALLIGLVIMLVMSIVGIYGKLYFDGLLSSSWAMDMKTNYPPSFLLLMYQNIVNVTVLALLFLLFSKIFGKKKIRIIDFFGTVAFSRYPYLILATLFWISQLLDPSLWQAYLSRPVELHFNIINSLMALAFIVCYWWQLLTYFFALKVSSGLDGKKLWISFIISAAAGELIAMHIGRIFLYV